MCVCAPRYAVVAAVALGAVVSPLASPGRGSASTHPSLSSEDSLLAAAVCEVESQLLGGSHATPSAHASLSLDDAASSGHTAESVTDLTGSDGPQEPIVVYDAPKPAVDLSAFEVCV